MRSFNGKSVLITGAGRGIGKRLAIGFANAGAKVGLLARSKAELDAAQYEIEHAGGTAMTLRADVRHYRQMCHAVSMIKKAYGRVDLLIAAAAVQGPIGPLADTNPSLWKNTLLTNIGGVLHSIRAVLPGMIERRSGKIIVLTGGGAANGRPFFSPYAATKAAVARLVESVAEEVRESNVQINCLAPGGAYTSMTDEILQAGERAGTNEIRNAEQVRVSGGVTPERQMQFALFLASDDSNHISGKMIHVNDDLKRLQNSDMTPDLYTLRRFKIELSK